MQSRSHKAPRVSLRKRAQHSTEEREAQPPVPHSIFPGPIYQTPRSPHLQRKEGPDPRARSPVESIETRIGYFRDTS